MLQVVKDNVAVHGLQFELQIENSDGYLTKQHDIIIVIVRRWSGRGTENSVTLWRQFWEQTY